MKTCKQCHKFNPDDAKFCAWCKSEDFESLSSSSGALLEIHANKILLAGVILVLIGIVGVFLNSSTPGGSKLALQLMRLEQAFSDEKLYSSAEMLGAYIGAYRLVFLLFGAVIAFVGYYEKKK